MFILLRQYVAYAAQINVTVDDQGLDPITRGSIKYEGDWNLQPGCSVCTATPEPQIDGTWHDASFDVTSPSQLPTNATFVFTGTAIYVFGMVDNFNGIELVFYLDGESSPGYTSLPSTEQPYQLNQLYFEKHGLSNTEHVLKLQNGRLDTMQKSVVLFDYLVYTRDDGSALHSTLLSPIHGLFLRIDSASRKLYRTARVSAENVFHRAVFSNIRTDIHNAVLSIIHGLR
ncbi:hypothetical protein PsYK624_054260 [Phanerochaete sordida]|uniref:Uncharacterized protein n=1 Tax=Phanerochaete sordida TaxID=48140 RepID=A0A9P3G771_9APHY|nr:hypothetical protein PsYK624_054260 [Phanerochaete sordida]